MPSYTHHAHLLTFGMKNSNFTDWAECRCLLRLKMAFCIVKNMFCEKNAILRTKDKILIKFETK